MKVVNFKIILPHPVGTTVVNLVKAQALLSAFNTQAKSLRTAYGTPETAIRGVTVSIQDTGVEDDLSHMVPCWVIEGQLRVNEEAPTPDPRDDRWGFWGAFGHLREQYGDRIPGMMRVFRTAPMFHVGIHPRQMHAARVSQENPATDGCEGDRLPQVATSEGTGDEHTISGQG